MSATIKEKNVISGANGLVGTELSAHLQEHGYAVVPMIRPQSRWEGEALRWEPSKKEIDLHGLNGVDTVVHLSGESIANGRWTNAKKQRIRSSRVDVTRFLAQSLCRLDQPPKTLICASAVGYYGDRGEEVLDESSAPGRGFLPDVCQEWEAAANPARQAGIRVVHLRFGVILSSKGGALKQMLTPFRIGVAGVLGNGKQYMSWVSMTDTIHIIRYCIENTNLEGAINVTSPNPVTNYEFTKTLGAVLSRPTLIPAPAIGLKLVLGEMADALLLASTCAIPKKLLEAGYHFHFTHLREALKTELR